MTDKDYTEILLSSTSGFGTNCIECGFCGRTHFTDYGDFAEGDWERLLQRAKIAPSRCVQHEDFISCREILGATWVSVCRCRMSRQLARWLYGSRSVIMPFFAAVHARRLLDLGEVKNPFEELDRQKAAIEEQS